MQTLAGYNKPVVALAISPDGTRLYSAARCQQVRAWDLSKLEVESKFFPRGDGGLDCSPDGKWLVSASEEGGASARLVGGEPRALIEKGEYFTKPRPAIAIHPTAPLVAVARRRSRLKFMAIEFWNLSDHRRVKTIDGDGLSISALAFSPAGDRLAAGSDDKTVRLWDHPSVKEVRSLSHKATPTDLSFRPDGGTLAVAAGRSVFVWEPAGGKLLHTLTGHEGNVTALRYSPDGKHLASVARDGTLILRDGTSHELLGRRHLDIGALRALVWRPDSSGVIVGGDKQIVLYAVDELLGTRQAKKGKGDPLSLSGHQATVRGLAYSPDGQALCSWDRAEVRTWDLSRGAGGASAGIAFNPKGTHRWDEVERVSWSPDGRHLAVRCTQSTQLWDTETAQAVQTREGAGYFGFTPSGRLLVAKEKTLTLEPSGAVGSSPAYSRQLTHSHIHNVVIRGPDDRHVYFVLHGHGYRWAPAKDELTELFVQSAEITGLVVSPDERLAVRLGGYTAHVLSLPDGERRFGLKHPLPVSGAGLIPGDRLLTSCNDGLVRMWDLSSGRELLALDLGMGKIYSFAVSPDDMTFAAGVLKKKSIVLMDVPE